MIRAASGVVGATVLRFTRDTDGHGSGYYGGGDSGGGSPGGGGAGRSW